LPSGSSIVGDVTVQRHMDGEGRIYRYISSPVQNSTVASLKDDFTVTGRFQDPSSGPGINSSSPSLFYYDQSVGGLAAGWRPYPASGLASANPLVVGKGYAAFIRKAVGPTIWDVIGPLNQGTIDLPIDFTGNNQPSNGWNLVGNPYACAIQWDEAGPDKWSMENISSVIAIRDNGIAGGTYKYWDMDDNYSGIPGGQIASGQSFWVRATAEGAALTIREGVKVADGAAFFRTERAAIPSFAISLSRGSVTDVAYYKIRPSASPGLDDWDGLKLDNELFDLSFVTADNSTMAIHATNKLPCDTIIQLSMKDLTIGRHALKLSTRYHFARYSFILLDKFLGTETAMIADVDLDFKVTSNPASAAADRLALKLVENAPKNDLKLSGPSSACEDDVVGLRIFGAEAGVLYSVLRADSVVLSKGMTESDNDLVISFRASALMPGENMLSVKGHATCHVVPLLGSHAIIRESTPRIGAEPVTACSGSTVILQAFSDKSNAEFFWFHEPNSTDTIGFEADFQTEKLMKSKVYYVAGMAEGCMSDRFAVKATITSYQQAQIEVIGDTILRSNYAFNNIWIFNGAIVEGANGAYLKLEDPGTYTLITDTLGCTSTAVFEYRPEMETHHSQVYLYPNPASEVLMIGIGNQVMDTLEIIDLQGRVAITKGLKELGEGSERPIIVRHLTAGAYIALVTASGKKQMIRFIKED
jgi:hypothetical protein